MAKGNLKEDLIRWLANNPQWHPKGAVTAVAWRYPDGRTYLPETVGRKLREAESESRIAVKEEGISVKYKFIPPQLRDKYIPASHRTDPYQIWKNE